MVVGGQDRVHVRECRRGGEHVRDPPAERDGGQDRADGGEREEVALVDAGRQDEEREGQDREAHEGGDAIRPAGDQPHDDGRGDHE